MKTTRTAAPSWPLLIGSQEIDDRRLPGGILVGIGSLAIVAAGFAASAVPQNKWVLRYGVLVAAVLVFAALCRSRGAALIVAGIGFLVFNGFLVNQLGELSWHGWADAGRIVALGAALIFGRLVGGIHRSNREVTPRGESRGEYRESFVEEERHDA